MHCIAVEGYALIEAVGPAEALFVFVRSLALEWSACDRALVEALAGTRMEARVTEADEELGTLLSHLLMAAQRSGSARTGVDVDELRALVVGCQAVQLSGSAAAAQITDTALRALRVQADDPLAH